SGYPRKLKRVPARYNDGEMSAQTTISKLRDEVAKLRVEKAMSDEELVTLLAESFTPDELRAFYRDSIQKDRANLSSAIEKVMFGTQTSQAFLPDGSPLAKAAAETYTPDVTKAVEDEPTPEEQK